MDVIAGAPEFKFLVRPYSIAADSRGRIIVTDPGAAGVHIFDYGQHKYKFIERHGKGALRAPQCVALDAQDNIYVTDSDSGDIFVFEAGGDRFMLYNGNGYGRTGIGLARFEPGT